jgi:hypothetical protein
MSSMHDSFRPPRHRGAALAGKHKNMAELFANGRIVDAVIALMLLEALLLLWLRARWRRGPAPADLLGNLAAGLFLLLALRAALVGAAWTWIAASLTAALVAHLYDLSRRWPRAGT